MTRFEKTLYKPHTLCEVCANAYGDCSWSEKGVQKPVEGWTAIRRDLATINHGQGRGVESYVVLECPQFVLQEEYRWAYEKFDPEAAKRHATIKTNNGVYRKLALEKKKLEA